MRAEAAQSFSKCSESISRLAVLPVLVSRFDASALGTAGAIDDCEIGFFKGLHQSNRMKAVIPTPLAFIALLRWKPVIVLQGFAR